MRNWQAKVRAHWTYWIELFLTMAVVIVAMVVGAWQIYIYNQQAKIMAAQAEIAQKQADIMNAQTNIAQRQANIAQKQFEESQLEGRAWVSMEPFIGGVSWDNDGVSINLKFVSKNSGKLPAMTVDWDTGILPEILADEHPSVILKKKSEDRRKARPMDILGVPLFPLLAHCGETRAAQAKARLVAPAHSRHLMR